MKAINDIINELQTGGKQKVTGKKYKELRKRSEEAAYRAVFDEYSAYVYTIVYNRASFASREDIEECVSDVFADVYRVCGGDSGYEGDLKGLIGITQALNQVITVDLSGAHGTYNGGSAGAYEVNNWLINHKYVYTLQFKLDPIIFDPAVEAFVTVGDITVDLPF